MVNKIPHKFRTTSCVGSSHNKVKNAACLSSDQCGDFILHLSKPCLDTGMMYLNMLIKNGHFLSINKTHPYCSYPC